MTLECGNCGSRYNIQDSLIPPQGARVKCKKCATVIVIPAPVVELAPHDLELIPPTPAAPPPPPESPVQAAPPPLAMPPTLPGSRSGAFDSSPFETSVQRTPPPRDEVEARAPEADMSPERQPQEPPPESTQDDAGFERSGAPARFGSPPSFAESAAAPSASRGGAMTLESPMASAMPRVVTPDEESATVEESHESHSAEPMAHVPEVQAAVPSSTSSLPTGTPLPEGLSADDRSKHEKARRLARVLASDISIYNREKKERGIREGNLVAMLGYEIKKSWEIYKERVGTDFANSTPYFRDALNEMLAEGKKIF